MSEEKFDPKRDGCMYALSSYGAQDQLVNEHAEHGDAYFDARTAMLRGTKKAISMYRAIDCHAYCESTTHWVYAIKPSCTFVNELDLVFRSARTMEAVVSVEVEIGGQSIDRIGRRRRPNSTHADFMTELRATCAMLSIACDSDLSMPLPLAPFYAFNAMGKSLVEHHDVHVRVVFSRELLDEERTPATLFGVCHFVSGDHNFATTTRPLSFNTVQHQTCFSPEDLRASAVPRWSDDREYFVSLPLNHPVYALCFWGHDPDDETYRVSLRLGGVVDDLADVFGTPIPILALRRRAASLGLRLPRGVDVIVFADFGVSASSSSKIDFSKRPTGLVNFSRIDNAELELLDGPKRDTLRVMALNMQPLRVMAGMCGLAFSK